MLTYKETRHSEREIKGSGDIVKHICCEETTLSYVEIKRSWDGIVVREFLDKGKLTHTNLSSTFEVPGLHMYIKIIMIILMK